MDTILAFFVVLVLLGVFAFGIRVLMYARSGRYEVDVRLEQVGKGW